MSVTEATQTLQIQDRMIRKLPEVVSVFGKAGQAESSTDPAPLSMFETVVQLKPSSEWRPGMTWDKLIAEMNANIKTPGMANIFWMPIQTRTEMLTTGFRSQLGIKVFGKDLGQIQNVSIQIEHTLADFPGTRSAFAERTTGGYFLDFTVDRKAAARYGLRVDDINDVIQTAIGGQTIATTVEGRERYPISVRYARDFRNDLDALKRVLVPVPALAETLSPNPEVSGASNPPMGLMPHIPISLVAKIGYKMGPPLIRSEDGQLVGFVFVDITSSDIDGYVRAAAQRINEQVKFPPGYYIQWAGQFQYLKEAEQRLAVVIPFTLLIIFVLIYINTRSAIKTIIVMLAVPFSLVGAFWMLYLLHYNMSVAVWVGLIALAGLDAETGVVMLLYLDQAWEKFVAEGRMRSLSDLYGAVKEGAVQRIRPKIMTVSAILFGLLPIMWSPATQAGADVMKRIATPMIGGVITSAILELLIYPVIYVIWRKHSLPAEPLAPSPLDGSGVPGSRTPASGSRRRVLVGSSAFLLTGILVASVYFLWSSGIASSLLKSTDPKTPVAEVTQDGVTISILSADGQIHTKENALQIKFKDPGGHPVAAENVKVELNMNMPGMVMHSGAKVMKDGMGDYEADLTPDMAGDWSVDVSYQGPQGPAQLKVPVNVNQ
jgi:copper/silver efflux system protein